MTKKNTSADALRSILVKGVGAATVQEVAQKAAQHQPDYDALVMLSCDAQMHTRMKASWAMAKATELNSASAGKHLPLLFERIRTETTQGVLRELYKTLAACTIPAKYEGAYIDISFGMLQNAETDLAVKHHAKLALMKYVKQYPELKSELMEALQRVINAHTEPWRVQVLKTLAKLEKMK
ncbi:MAG: hypothetical protein ACKVOR_05330 [Flavobacteriales bacterium]